MKLQTRFLLLPAALTMLSSLSLLAQNPANSIQNIHTFSYPEASGFTEAQGINEQGDITGVFMDGNFDLRGFIRYHDGTFSPPIAAPGDTLGVTVLSGIDSTPTECGYYPYASTDYHSFFLTGGVFTTFDVAGADSTFVNGINDAGDFVGSANFGEDSEAFANLRGVMTTLDILGSIARGANAISRNGLIVGIYYTRDDSGAEHEHGFFRDQDGNLTYPFDYPGASTGLGTNFRGVNSRGQVVGHYFDTHRLRQGFLFQGPNRFLGFRFPGATSTDLTAINDRGVVCGHYTTTNGAVFSFVGKVH